MSKLNHEKYTKFGTVYHERPYKGQYARSSHEPGRLFQQEIGNRYKKATKEQLKRIAELEELLGIEFDKHDLRYGKAAFYIREGEQTLASLEE
ncbi:hypothetical protein [Bacillus phage Nachito]|nr:hypothetical protein [Bacillus phage Nachito]